MTPEDREAYLAGVHVGIVSVADGSNGPLAVPIWYDYEPGGDVIFITGRDTRKGRLLERAERLTLVAQTEAPPYKYVTVEGPFSIEPTDTQRDLKPMARRYLGIQGGDEYVANSTGDSSSSMLVRMHPERWLSVDYS